jgi:MFS family permease
MGHSPDGLALPDRRKTSIWLALKNPVFKGYWLAALISGTCVAAHNTAAFSVLGQESDSTILISLMSTLSSLPFALFTLPAGALADMAERKKILYGTCLWQASVALCLAILAVTDWLSPHIILVSVFLFGIGFAFASPASASVEVEMVPPEHLASANTLGGLQMNIAGIIGPLLGGFLVSLSGSGAAFAANSAGFLLLLLAISRWKKPAREAKSAPEDFFATIETAIRYVRYISGIKVILARLALFSFFISIIPALMPVVGLKELHLDPSNLGFLFTAMATGSVIAAVCIMLFAKQVDSLREYPAHPDLVFDGLRQLAEGISAAGGPRGRGVDAVRNRAMDCRSAGHAGLGSGTPECNHRHVLTSRDRSGWRDLGIGSHDRRTGADLSRRRRSCNCDDGSRPLRGPKAALDRFCLPNSIWNQLPSRFSPMIWIQCDCRRRRRIRSRSSQSSQSIRRTALSAQI